MFNAPKEMNGTKCRIRINNEEVYKINEFKPVFPNDFLLIQSNNIIRNAEAGDIMYPAHPNGTDLIIHAYGTTVNITTHSYPECQDQPGLNITNKRATRFSSLQSGNRNRYFAKFCLFLHYKNIYNGLKPNLLMFFVK